MPGNSKWPFDFSIWRSIDHPKKVAKNCQVCMHMLVCIFLYTYQALGHERRTPFTSLCSSTTNSLGESYAKKKQCWNFGEKKSHCKSLEVFLQFFFWLCLQSGWIMMCDTTARKFPVLDLDLDVLEMIDPCNRQKSTTCITFCVNLQWRDKPAFLHLIRFFAKPLPPEEEVDSRDILT